MSMILPAVALLVALAACWDIRRTQRYRRHLSAHRHQRIRLYGTYKRCPLCQSERLIRR